METFKFNDGGRSSYFKSTTEDCVTRAISIAANIDYIEVYNFLAKENASQGEPKSARNGINTKQKWFKNYMSSLGFQWVPLMFIGSGCTVHLKQNELPKNGRLVLNLSRHLAAYVDGVLNDTYNCSREGRRCVYGYWILNIKQNASS